MQQYLKLVFPFFLYIYILGQGGTGDHTNVIIPEVSIITTVALDHTHMLGRTREEGLTKKAGIIKKGVPVILGYDMPLELAKELAEKKNSQYYIIYPTDVNNFTFDELNKKIARKALEVGGSKFPKLREEAYSEGLKAKPPGRLQVVQLDKLRALKEKWHLQKIPLKVYLDVGHNPQAIVSLYIYIYIIYKCRILL